jgi:hypothetical protein
MPPSSGDTTVAQKLVGTLLDAVVLVALIAVVTFVQVIDHRKMGDGMNVFYGSPGTGRWPSAAAGALWR